MKPGLPLKPGLWMVCLMALFLSACQDSKVEKLLNQANEEWVRGRNHSAVEHFKSVLEIAPTGVYAEEALFRLGEINLYGMNDHIQAINYFKEVVQENPLGPFRYDAQKYIAEIVETNFKDYDQAIIEYQNLIDRNQVPEDNPEHQFKIATLFIKKQSYDQAVVEFEQLLESYPESDWSAQAQYKIVELYYTLGKCEPARQRYQEFIKGKLKNAFKGEMDFVMASCLEEEGKLLVAYKSFKALEGKYKYPAMVKMKLEGLEGRIKKSKQPNGKSRKKKRSRRRR